MVDIVTLLGQMKKADERTEVLNAEKERVKKEKPSRSGLINKQKYLRGLRGFRSY